MSPEPSTAESTSIERGYLPEFVDWILGALIALSGLTFMVGGSALTFLVDREVLAEDIQESPEPAMIMTRELTQAEMVDVADALVSWLGAGLLLTGILLVLFAVMYVIYRHRAHQRAREGEEISSYWAFAVLGGVSTAFLSFVPFSPVLGGGIAGFLEWHESDRTVSVGALAGVLPALPVMALVVILFGGLMAGMLAVDEGGLASFFAVVAILAVFFIAVFAAGLGALGGYLGGWIANRRRTSSESADV